MAEVSQDRRRSGHPIGRPRLSCGARRADTHGVIRRALVLAAAVLVTSSCTPAFHPDGGAVVPPEAAPVDTSHPDHVIGDGTPASCTSAAVVAAVAHGGVITFDCGPDPSHHHADRRPPRSSTTPAPRSCIDGGGKVTLSGGGKRRILYMNTCDQAQVWTTSHCQDQDSPAAHRAEPHLRRRQLHRRDHRGRRRRRDLRARRPVQGRQLALLPQRLRRDRPRRRRRAVRVLEPVPGPAGLRRQQHLRRRRRRSATRAPTAARLSSIGVSWTVLNSLFSYNHAIGNGANPAQQRHARRRQRRRHLQRRQHVHPPPWPARSSRTTTPTRAAARSSSSATTAPARCDRATRRSAATRATASRPPASPASSTWAVGHPRSSTAPLAEAARYSPASLSTPSLTNSAALSIPPLTLGAFSLASSSALSLLDDKASSPLCLLDDQRVLGLVLARRRRPRPCACLFPMTRVLGLVLARRQRVLGLVLARREHVLGLVEQSHVDASSVGRRWCLPVQPAQATATGVHPGRWRSGSPRRQLLGRLSHPE